MKRIIHDVSRWSIFLHRTERKLPLVKDNDEKDRQFEDEVFERLYSGRSVNLKWGERDHENAEWAKWGHDECAKLGLEKIEKHCLDHAFNSALATAWFMELIEEPLGGAKSDAKERAEAAAREERVIQFGLEHVALGGGGAPKTKQLDPRILRIALMAGRLKSSIITRQRRKLGDAEEIIGVTLGGELENIIPSEMVRFVSPRFRLAFMRDFVEHNLMQYEMVAQEQVAECGPIIVCIDKSSSMEGERDEWASAIALGLLDVAHRQSRAFSIVSFNHDIIKTTVVPAGGKLSVSDLAIAPDGGTFIALALRESLRVLREHGTMHKADIILISDGEDENTALAAPLKERAEKLGATIYGIGIDTADVAPWCHETHKVTDLSTLDERVADALFAI